MTRIRGSDAFSPLILLRENLEGVSEFPDTVDQSIDYLFGAKFSEKMRTLVDEVSRLKTLNNNQAALQCARDELAFRREELTSALEFYLLRCPCVEHAALFQPNGVRQLGYRAGYRNIHDWLGTIPLGVFPKVSVDLQKKLEVSGDTLNSGEQTFCRLMGIINTE